MCGIIGFVGTEEATPILLEGLKRLEYRGYDSAGLVLVDGDSLRVVKEVGTVDKLVAAMTEVKLHGSIGMAHTRWATHGGVTRENAHPHLSCDGGVAVIHNGIIENFAELKAELEAEGHVFKSQTDTEVIPHLLERYLKDGMDLATAGVELSETLKGQFAIVAVSSEFPSSLLALRRKAPLMIGIGRGENIVASDALAFIDRTNKAIFMDDDTIAVVSNGPEVKLYSAAGQPIKPVVVEVAQELSTPDKENYEHYTIKEIMEQPTTVRRVLDQDAGTLTFFRRELENAKRVFFIASGSSFHAGMLGRLFLSENLGIYSEVVVASEYRSVEGWFREGTVVIAISQSGETADVLTAVGSARAQGATVISIVNRAPSTLERYSDVTLKLNAGTEVGVAATKSLTAQVALLFRVSKKDSEEKEIEELCVALEAVLRTEPLVVKVAEAIKESKDVYFLGRGLGYPVALEGALKLKELAYLHAEGLAAGELKHGPLALVEGGTPLVLVNPEDETHEETLSNGAEVKARGGTIIGVSTESNRLYDWFLKVPRVPRQLMPIVEVVPLQLLAYHTARLLNADVDRPRNLAKSVTVK
ncbi:MAG TPA: glutamine--fructose-6-phosphate transaminase (isomerizing) [Conexivisphaerales archaeon]|nr:glutamine--fructose-6-phosphate transaminase (isomerizing) [Conexivisphaerales archaeon]